MVWITKDVDLPLDLLEAQSAGKLVLFVGAGVSMGDPSNLPSFAELARQLAEAARVPFNPGMPLDLFLGSMPRDFETHAHARRLIARPESRFNRTHLALARLASAHARPRIVTTNFDVHLTEASAAAGLPEQDIWVGPALPLGDDFCGSVYLHGSILRPPKELVLTDGDFGRAYLTDAWATRFLQRMFDQFTVLFVGYSHDDPIMRYVAMGLSSTTRRFVLTHLPHDDKWAHLGITPVPYPAVGQDHAALPAALEAWDRRTRMGRLEHRAMMRETVAGGLPLNPIDEDYLRQRLETAEGVVDFTGYARGADWLRWAETVEQFRGLFVGAPDSQAGQVFSQWLGDAFVTDPQLNDAVLGVVQRLGQRFSPSLFHSLSWAAEALTEKHDPAGRKWKVLLATSIEGVSAPPDLGMLLRYEPGDKSEDLALIREAVRPLIRLKVGWTLNHDQLARPPRAEVTWLTDEQVLTSHLNKLVEDRPPADPALGALLEDALGSAYELLASYEGEGGHDALNWHRSAIEPHPQDEYREPLDALIDGLRDYGAKALAAQPWLPQKWWSHGAPLFRRLALSLLEASPGLSDSGKLRWVLDRNILFDASVKHEAYRLLASALPGADDDSRRLLLADVLRGPNLPSDVPDLERHKQYGIYNMLVWLTRSDVTWADAKRELDRVQSENQDFGPRDFPDLDSWSSGVTWGEALPMAVEDFVRDLAANTETALATLLKIDYSERRIDGPTWGSALTLVRQASARSPRLGLRLWEALEADVGEKTGDLQTAVLEGWAQADLGERLGDIVVAVSGFAQGQSSNPRAISAFLVSQIEKNLDGREGTPFERMRELANTTWELNKGSFEPHEGTEPSLLALNSWPGDLARYWVFEVNRHWREMGDAWKGLNFEERMGIEALLGGPPGELDAIRPALGGEAYFLFAADPAFAELHILTLFDGPAGAQAWQAFLHHPRYTDRMLASGFLKRVNSEWERLHELGTRGLQQQFYGLVASIICLSDITAAERQALLDQTVLSDNGEHAADFAQIIFRFFNDDELDGAAMWDLWARDHLAARLQGLPRNPRPEELERWADIAPLVGDHAEQAFNLLSGHGIGLGDNYHAPNWPTDLLLKKPAALVSHLEERVRNSTPSGWVTPHSVRELVDVLTNSLGDALCAPLVEAAMESGFLPPD